MRLTWLADALRGAGLTVVEVPGWQTRGRDLPRVNGMVIHDTVTTPSWSDQRVADLLRDGREGLAGPLSQLGMDRHERVYVVAAGRANHNGYGTWGNDAVGLEVFCAGGLAGHEEPQTQGQQEAGALATATVLDRLGLPRDRCMGHKETDPRRKIDPFRVDMNRYRQMVVQASPGGLTVADVEQIGEWLGETEGRIVKRVNDKAAADRKVLVEDIAEVKAEQAEQRALLERIIAATGG